METSPHTAGTSALVAGSALTVLAAVHLLTEKPFDDVLTSTADYLNDGSFALALISGAVAVTGLVSFGASVRWTRAAATGQVLVCLGVVAGLVTGTSPSWFAVVAVPGLLTWLVSSVVIARATWKQGSLPRLISLGIGLLMPTTVILAAIGGSLVASVVWFALAARWLTAQRAPVSVSQLA